MKLARYLIVGASGYIGSHVYRHLGPERSIGTYHRTPFAGGVKFDPLTMSLAETVLRNASGIGHAFLFHAISSIDECAKNPVAYRINVEAHKRMIEDLLAAEIVPIFASSDAVFDGSHGMWTETDPVNPILTYGRHKAEIEKYLRENAERWIAVRLSKVVSSRAAPSNILSGWLEQLERGDTIRCAHDQIFSPVDIDDVTRVFSQFTQHQLYGIYHVCGSGSGLSRLQLLQMLAKHMSAHRASTSSIIPCSIRDFDFAETRPLDTSMSCQKLCNTLGTRFTTMETVCERAVSERYDRLHTGITSQASGASIK